MRSVVVVLLAMLIVGVQIPAVLSQEATPPPVDIQTMRDRAERGDVCAWPAEVAIDAMNVAYPETNASYFIMPYLLTPGQSLVLEGAFPFARFSSLTTYYGLGAAGQGIQTLDWLRDDDITPNEGSVNPAVEAEAPDDGAQRQWTVRLTGTLPVDGATPVDISASGENIIAAHPEGVTGRLGILAYRIYVPDDQADATGGVGLPALFFEDANGDRRAIAECTAEDQQAWVNVLLQLVLINVAATDQLPLPPSADALPEWVQARIPGLAPNPDNRYLIAPLVWEPGRIVVIRGQAPTFPDTRAGESQATPSELRFWSFCTGSNTIDPPMPYPTTDCIGDSEIPLDAEGTYTVVVSQPEDQPVNATAENGIAWLQGADPALPDLVGLRHMLPSEDFYDLSVWAVPELTIGAAEPIMGPYFPQITYCDVATFEEGGADACFAAGDAATPAG
jgi:hypothetical protein